MSKEKIKATIWAILVTVLLARLIVLGSNNLRHFDAALVECFVGNDQRFEAGSVGIANDHGITDR